MESSPAYLDQEEAAKILQDKDIVSIPVVGKKSQLVGVVHVDDILDVRQEETTVDIHRMMKYFKYGSFV